MTETTPEPPTVAELLRLTLDAQGMSQVDLAEQTGLSTKHINQIMQDDVSLSPHCAWLIGYATGIPAEVWITLQAVRTVWKIAREEPPRGEPVIPKLRRQRDDARRERDQARDIANRLRRVLRFQMTPDIARWDDGFAIQLDRLPDWLTDDTFDNPRSE